MPTINTLDALKQLIAEKLDVPIKMDNIDPDAPLLESGMNLDSLAIVELITLCEETFAMEFGENDLNIDTFASLRTLAGVIDGRTGQQAAAVA